MLQPSNGQQAMERTTQRPQLPLQVSHDNYTKSGKLGPDFAVQRSKLRCEMNVIIKAVGIFLLFENSSGCRS